MSYDVSGPNLSDLSPELMNDEFGGAVESQFAKASIMGQFVPVRRVVGTDTIFNNRVGKTTIKKLTAGVRPPADTTPFGKVKLTVDTVVLIRDARSMLNEFQTHFSAREELGKDHGKQMGKFYDEAFLIMGIKGATAPAPDFGAGAHKNSIGGGKNAKLTGANDHNDPDKLAAAMADIIVQMEEEEIEVDELVWFVRPKTHQTLRQHEKLVSRDYSGGNADFAKAVLYEIEGVRIEKTARLPNEPIKDHFLSNAENEFAYDVNEDQAKCVALLIHPKSFLAGETIPLQTKVFWDDGDKTWYIDAWMAFAVAVNRPDVCGAVFRA